jgi:hypothetical protein
LLSRFGNFLAKIDDELEEVPEVAAAETAVAIDSGDSALGQAAGKDDLQDGQDGQDGAPLDEQSRHAEETDGGGRLEWSLAELLTAVEMDGISSADTSLLGMLRKGKKTYDESLLIFLEEVLTCIGPSDARHRHLLQVI